METAAAKEIVGKKLDVLFESLDVLDWTTKEFDYVATCGIVASDIPALIDLAADWMDPEFHDQTYKTVSEYRPVFAWRTLGQLEATEAIEPLLAMSNVLDEHADEWFLTEFPAVFSLIGEPALKPLADFLGDEENNEFARACAADSIKEIGSRRRHLRDSAVRLLNQELGKFASDEPFLNGSLVAFLLDLNAVEAVQTLEKAHSLDVVDTSVCGKWEIVKAELGVEGSGLAMPEFPCNSTSGSDLPTAARNAADRLFEHDELNGDALRDQNEMLAIMFRQSPEFQGLSEEDPNWPSTLLEIAASYLGVSFLNISLNDVNEVLYEIFPRKVSTTADSAAQIIDQLHGFFKFIDRVFETKEAKKIANSLTGDAADRLQVELADSSNFGMAKSMWAQGSAAGFDMTRENDVSQFIELYNRSLNPDHAGDPGVSMTMTPDEKRVFNKKRKKQLAKKQQKKKKKR